MISFYVASIRLIDLLYHHFSSICFPLPFELMRDPLRFFRREASTARSPTGTSQGWSLATFFSLLWTFWAFVALLKENQNRSPAKRAFPLLLRLECLGFAAAARNRSEISDKMKKQSIMVGFASRSGSARFDKVSKTSMLLKNELE